MTSTRKAMDWLAYPLIAGLVVLLALAMPAAGALAALGVALVALIGRWGGGRDG
jgi:hypothetical protein